MKDRRLPQKIHSGIRHHRVTVNAYAAAMNLIRELQEHASDHREDIPGSSYVLEKISVLHWHSGAMFGFDIDNGQDSNQHHAWALAAIRTLQDSFKK